MALTDHPMPPWHLWIFDLNFDQGWDIFMHAWTVEIALEEEFKKSGEPCGIDANFWP